MKMIKKHRIILSLFLLGLLTLCDVSNATADFEARGKNGMVVTSEKLASEVGIQILKQGGNAVDAAVAVGFALAVTYPTAGNIGGGGFMVILFPDGESTTVDFREKAPIRATAEMYLDEQGDIIPGKSVRGYLACGVPGSVAGLVMTLEKYGTMKLKTVMEPALKLAKQGFPVSHSLHQDFKRLKSTFQKYPSSAKVFLKETGEIYQEGEIFRQPDLYKTLKLISEQGAAGFYQGKVANLIVRDMQRNGGLIRHDDLEKYQEIERPPVKGNYRGYQIVGMGPPSSGGIALIQSLNLLQHFDLSIYSYHSSRYIHLLSEILRHVFALRAHYLGDTDFVDVPVETFLSKEYAEQVLKQIDLNRALPSDSLQFLNPFRFEGDHTTHYNVVDKNQMVVAVTTTINSGYGSKAVVDGAGFLLNNEMDDFATKIGNPNIYGLIEFKANRIEPEKRMLSSMSPTIVTKDGKLVLAVGAMGGPKIITATLQTIINVIDFNMPLFEAIASPRIHHQWKPDKIYVERLRFPNDVIVNLKNLGHEYNKMGFSSEVTAIKFDLNAHAFIGSVDFRWHGHAAGY